MAHQLWCDITLEVAEKARQAGESFGQRRSKMQKKQFIDEVMAAEANILRMKIELGDKIGNAQEVSRLFASAALRFWYKANEKPSNTLTSNIVLFSDYNVR